MVYEEVRSNPHYPYENERVAHFMDFFQQFPMSQEAQHGVFNLVKFFQPELQLSWAAILRAKRNVPSAVCLMFDH